MQERPILFSGEMVQAILDGRKTQTRRLPGLETVNQGKCDLYEYREHGMFRSLFGGTHQFPQSRYGKTGDGLWVRETWAYCKRAGGHYLYRADGEGFSTCKVNKWKPSIHMPRTASRITLEVVSVRVERLQEISEEDAKAEGVPVGQCTTLPGEDARHALCIHCRRRGNEHIGVSRVCTGRSTCFNPRTYKGGFAFLWDQINGKRMPWAWNPWVWVVEFALAGWRGEHRLTH